MSQTESPLKSSVGISYTTTRFLPQYQYLGFDIEYRFMPKSWLGLEANVGRQPETINSETPSAGGPLVEATASILVGHRWGRYRLYGDVGAGTLRTGVFEGIAPNSYQPVFDRRYYPDVVLGSLLDIAVSRSWSLTFAVRDNVTLIGPYTAKGFSGPIFIPAGTVNALETRTGVAFRF